MKQIENIAFVKSGISFVFFGKGDVDLSNDSAVVAMDTGNPENNRYVFSSKGKRTKTTFFAALAGDVAGFATGTNDLGGRSGNVKLDTAGNELLTDKGIPPNAEHVVQ